MLSGYILRTDSLMTIVFTVYTLLFISKQSFGGVYRNHCPSVHISCKQKTWPDIDETIHSCSIQSEDVHEGW